MRDRSQSRTQKSNPRLQLRMGVHSGPVSGVVDVNNRPNSGRAPASTSRRPGDGAAAMRGTFLLSKTCRGGSPKNTSSGDHFLHDLGTCEVKHWDAHSALPTFMTVTIGNSQLPKKISGAEETSQSRALGGKRPSGCWWSPCLRAGVVYFLAQRTGSFRSPLPWKKSIAVLPFRKSERRKSERLLHRGAWQGRDLDPSGQDCRSQSDQPHERHAVQKRARRAICVKIGQPTRPWQHVVEGSVQRAAKQSAGDRPIDRCPATTRHLVGTNLRSRSGRCLRHPKRDREGHLPTSLQAKLSPNEKKAIEQPRPPLIWRPSTFTAGRSHFSSRQVFSATNEPDLRKAIELLDEAVKRDPSFFDAYCQLAFAHESVLLQYGGLITLPPGLPWLKLRWQAATRLRPDCCRKRILARAQYLYPRAAGLCRPPLAELEIARRALPNDPRLFELTGYILRRPAASRSKGLRNLERAGGSWTRATFFTLQTDRAQSFKKLRPLCGGGDRCAGSGVSDRARQRRKRGPIVDYFISAGKRNTRPLHQTIDAILAQGIGRHCQRCGQAGSFAVWPKRDPGLRAERALVALGRQSMGRRPRLI